MGQSGGNGVLVFIAMLVAVVYWAGVLGFAVLQFYVICPPALGNCPTIAQMSLRALGVLTVGLLVFALSVWIIGRIHALLAARSGS